MLFRSYFFRDDLQKKFSNLKEKLSDLIDWAATEGVSFDISRSALLPYNRYYVDNCSSSLKILAKAIYLFNHNLKLQAKFPEVFAGKYENLLSYYKTNKTSGELKS